MELDTSTWVWDINIWDFMNHYGVTNLVLDMENGVVLNYDSLSDENKTKVDNILLTYSKDSITKGKVLREIENIDKILQSKLPRMFEDLLEGTSIHPDIQVLIDKKKNLRNSLSGLIL